MADENEHPIKNRIQRLSKVIAVTAALCLAFLIFLIVRGSWADSNARIPTTAEQGAISQLYLNPNGQKQIRCAAVLNYPASKVWAVVTDYAHFGEIFGDKFWTMKFNNIEQQPNNVFHVTGGVSTKLGGWPLDLHITHTESAEKYVASWDESGGNIKINRGSWTITPISADKSLIVYSLESQISPFPQFITNNIFFSQLKAAMRSVDQRLKTTQ